MNKDFRNYNEAKKYAEEIRNNGLKAYIEEFHDFDGKVSVSKMRTGKWKIQHR